MIRKTAAAAVFGAIALSASTSAAQGLPMGCTRVGLPATCHSCTHSAFGPYAAVTAQAADATFVYSELNLPHTYYTVTLPAAGGAGTFSGRVAYISNALTPTPFAFYLNRDVPIRVSEVGGSDARPILQHAITDSQTDCSTVGYASTLPCARSLPIVHVFTLAPDTPYHVVLGPSAVNDVSVVIENLESIGSLYYADADGDGFGDPEVSVRTWCVPNARQIEDGSDCDDTNARTFPDAPELCNGRDDNCDEQVDEVPCIAADAGVIGPDAAVAHDAGAVQDAGTVQDTGAIQDANAVQDTGAEQDAGAEEAPPDGPPTEDPIDTESDRDAGETTTPQPDADSGALDATVAANDTRTNDGCNLAPGTRGGWASASSFALALAFVLARRRRR